jgi:type III secretion protein N (ATPase)
VTGIRVIDGCLALGYGQRIGLFAGPGVGKSTLLGMTALRAKADVSVVCLVGERGREVNEFLYETLGKQGLARSVVVVGPADAPPMARVRALDTATAIAEWFRAQGKAVLLLVDSLTRAVRAKREAAFALGEPPSRGGYPASAFSFLPGIIERAGNDDKGSITAIYAVLTEGGKEDPIAEEVRSLLDGHIVLSEKRAQAAIRPAVDILKSVSRVFEKVVPPHIVDAATRLKRLQSAYEENEDLILMGAYRRGASKDTDAAMDKKDAMEAFFNQTRHETSTVEETFEALLALVCV